MTYQRIYDLKFNKNLPTYKLGKRYPHERKKISRIALLELPFSALRWLVDGKELEKLRALKEWLSGKKRGRKKSF